MSDQTKRYIGVGLVLLTIGLIAAAAEQIRSERFSRWLAAVWDVQPEPAAYPPAEA